MWFLDIFAFNDIGCYPPKGTIAKIARIERSVWALFAAKKKQGAKKRVVKTGLSSWKKIQLLIYIDYHFSKSFYTIYMIKNVPEIFRENDVFNNDYFKSI